MGFFYTEVFLKWHDVWDLDKCGSKCHSGLSCYSDVSFNKECWGVVKNQEEEWEYKDRAVGEQRAWGGYDEEH